LHLHRACSSECVERHCHVNRLIFESGECYSGLMTNISYHRHRFPPEIIQSTVWLYSKFTLSYRDIEDLLAERGLDVSYETIRRWVNKFGSSYARRIRSNRPGADTIWHLG